MKLNLLLLATQIFVNVSVLTNIWLLAYNIKESNDNQVNEQNLLSFLNTNGGSGIRLFKGDINDLSSWTPMG